MKQFKLVDSLKKPEIVRHIREFVKKRLNKKLDKHWKREDNGIEVKTIITKQEIWIKG